MFCRPDTEELQLTLFDLRLLIGRCDIGHDQSTFDLDFLAMIRLYHVRCRFAPPVTDHRSRAHVCLLRALNLTGEENLT